MGLFSYGQVLKFSTNIYDIKYICILIVYFILFLKEATTMKKILNRLLDAARNYTVWDYGCLKIVLISLGILLGTYFSNFFLRYTSLLWAIFIVSYIRIIYRTFKSLK